MLYAKVRDGDWIDIHLCDLEGQPLSWSPEDEWVKAVCVDSVTGLYVLTDNETRYFTAPSIDLEFEGGN